MAVYRRILLLSNFIGQQIKELFISERGHPFTLHDESAVTNEHRRNESGGKCIVKSIRGHWRLENEVSILRKYQATSPLFRPLEDEIVDLADPPSIVLKYLNSDLRAESNQQRLSRPDIKKVAKCVLEALRILHRDGMVHTGSWLGPL